MINYENGVLSGVVLNSSIDNTEVDLFSIIDEKNALAKSQVTIYYGNVDMGTLTSLAIRYYFWSGMVDNSGAPVWQLLPIKNLSTGLLKDTPSVIGSGSYNDGTYYQTLDSMPIQACLGFKVTAQGTGDDSTPAVVGELRAMLRNN